VSGFSIDVDAHAVDAAIADEASALSRRVRLATDKTGRDLLLDVRGKTQSAFRGSKRLANAWRGKLYPDGGDETLSPAYFIHTKAPQIIDAFERGATIRARGGKYLAIAMPDAGVRHTSIKNKAITPAIWEKETGVKLRPLIRGSVILLVADAHYVRQPARWRARKSFKPIREPLMNGRKFLVIFILVRQVKLSKRLDIAAIARDAGAKYASSYEKAANAS